MDKAQFIRSLQELKRPLSPYEISQLIRVEYGWVSLYRADFQLNSEIIRGYMVVPREGEDDRSPESPAIYWCVIASDQELGYQQLTWVKEILHVLDAPEQRTNTPDRLRSLLESRSGHGHNGDDPPNVSADKNGVILALGCMVPRAYREIMRKEEHVELYGVDALAAMLQVPTHMIEGLVSEEFEEDFERVLCSI